MTWNGRTPTRSGRDDRTAYERSRANDVAFDYDGHSCMHVEGTWPLTDVEDLTILTGLESVASESDTR